MNSWTIKALLDWMTPYLEDKHVDAPRLCAEMLMCHVLAKQRIDLYTQFDMEVPLWRIWWVRPSFTPWNWRSSRVA